MVRVVVKWSKQVFSDVEVDFAAGVAGLRARLEALTGVPAERQKIMGVKGGVLKDGADLSTLIKDGQQLMLMGTAEKPPEAPKEATVFMEDLSERDLGKLEQSAYPAGLVNLGNTCYMNSTLQVVRQCPELVAGLQGYTGRLNDYDGPNNIVCTLRDLYGNLDRSREAVVPAMFLQSLRDAYPQFAEQSKDGKYMQQDAEECWSQLITAVQQKLNSSNSVLPPNFVDELLFGEQEIRYKCEETGEEQVQREPFAKLQCHITAATRALQDGLREAMDGQMEKNSQTLGRDAVHTKTTRITRLPKYLTIQFMRFFWKAAQKVRAKILKPVQFPLIFDAYEYCSDELKAQLGEARARHLSHKEALRTAELERKAALQAAMDAKDGVPSTALRTSATTTATTATTTTTTTVAAAATEPATAPPPSSSGAAPMEVDGKAEATPASAGGAEDEPSLGFGGRYELVGVVTHIGRSIDSGHYVGWAKVPGKKDSWLKFDDDTVTPCKDEDIVKLKGDSNDWHIAYITLYRAIS